MLVSATFINSLSTNDGKISLNVQAETDGGNPLATNNLQVGIIGPGGIVVQAYNESDSLAVFPNLGSTTWMTDLPLDSNGNYIPGEYVVTVSLRKTGSSSRYAFAQETFNYIPVVPAPGASAQNGLTYAVNCNTAEITFSDTTSTTGYINVSRSWLLTHPLPNVGNRPGDLTSTAQTGAFTFTLTGGEYSLRLIVLRQKNVEEGGITFIQLEALSKTVSFVVNCGANLCAVYDCFKNGYDEISASVGGKWDSMSSSDIGNAIRLLLNATGAQLSRDCAPDEFVVFAENTDICGCGCAGASAPQVVPYP